ncbi:MAG: hypothetical protein AVDCRST_MAG41-4190, partial [uncultured Corynebacteriales bacterium]
DAVGAGGHRGPGQRQHQVPPAARVRGVDDDRQVRHRVHHRHRGHVQHVADRRLEGPHAPLAQHDVQVAALGDVLGRHQPLLV